MNFISFLVLSEVGFAVVVDIFFFSCSFARSKRRAKKMTFSHGFITVLTLAYLNYEWRCI